MIMSKSEAQIFWRTMCQFEMGFVCKSSMVPVWISLENIFMVMAGIRNNRIQGRDKKSC